MGRWSRHPMGSDGALDAEDEFFGEFMPKIEKDSDDDPLGIFDDEMDDSSPYVEMDEKEKAFLLDFVAGIEKLSNDCFDMDTFKNNLVLHPYYVPWDRLEGKKNLSGISDSKDEIEIFRLKGIIRKNSGKI